MMKQSSIPKMGNRRRKGASKFEQRKERNKAFYKKHDEDKKPR